MKSERAKKHIDNDTIEFRNGDRMIDASTAYMAIDLAEQEAEERVRAELTCWISPEDFYPEANKNVLVKCSSGEIQTDFYAPELGGFFIEHSTYAKVIGWREIHE